MSNKVVLFFAVLCLVAAGPAPGEPSDRLKWQQWKLKFDKVYAPMHEADRFAVFVENLKVVEERNARQKVDKVHHWMSPFMDLSVAEFKATMLMNVPHINFRDYSKGALMTRVNVSALPSSYNAATLGLTTPVKNQGQCGSCWDFSATETYESACKIAGHQLHRFSEQQTVDCDTNGQDQGCNGGLPEGAYAYLISNGGVESEANYPYTAEDGTCNENSSELENCKITNWNWVTQSSDEGAMQAALYAKGPLSICVDASSWSSYTGGILEASACTNNIDHCVQATGWMQKADANGNMQQVWIVRNSWGTSWGSNSMPGFIFLQYGQDTCAMADHVTLPVVQ